MASNHREVTHVLVFSQVPEQAERFMQLFDMSGLKAGLTTRVEEFKQYVATSTIDLIILAADQVEAPAFELCSDMHQHSGTQCEVPVIFIFDVSIPPEVRIQSLHMGAYDYIVEPYNEIELLTKVAVLANVKHVETEFRELAIRDRLTGLFDRRHLMVRMQEEFSRARRYRNPISIITLDVDSLAAVNDEFGIEAGDSVLKHLAELMVAGKREIDVAARLEDDCFVLILYKTDVPGAQVLANRLIESTRSAAWAFSDDFKLSLSLGLAGVQLAGDTDISVQDLHSQAATALQQAKDAGGNQLVVYSD